MHAGRFVTVAGNVQETGDMIEVSKMTHGVYDDRTDPGTFYLLKILTTYNTGVDS